MGIIPIHGLLQQQMPGIQERACKLGRFFVFIMIVDICNAGV